MVMNMSKMKNRWLCTTIAAVLCAGTLLTGCGSTVGEGVSLMKEKKYEEAKGKFEESIKAGDDLEAAYRGLGNCYYELGKYERAADAFEKALNEGTEPNAVLYNLVGISQLKAQCPDKALYYFTEGMKYEDVSGELRKEMAFNEIVCYEELGEYHTAQDKLVAFIEQYPEDEAAKKEIEFLSTQLKPVKE